MDESRPRFVESAEMILGGLETGYCEYDGAFVKQPRAAIRPAPFKSFRGRTYAAAVSPESLPIMAKLGVGILIIPQKPWHEVAKELETYRSIYRQVNGVDAPPPVSAGWTFCDRDPERAREMARRYIGGYYQTVLDHYQFQGDHLATTKGYEYYGKMSGQDRSVWNRHRHRLLRESASVGHARAVLRQDPRHPPADGQQPLRRSVLVRGDAVRRGRAQHSPLRAPR